MAHLVEGGHHELIAADFTIQPGKELAPMSRRQLQYDKRKLKEPCVAAAARTLLAAIPLPGIHIEQSSRCHMINEEVHRVLCEVSPKDKKTARQHWVSDQSVWLI